MIRVWAARARMWRGFIRLRLRVLGQGPEPEPESEVRRNLFRGVLPEVGSVALRAQVVVREAEGLVLHPILLVRGGTQFLATPV